MTPREAVEALENAITFLEALGYHGGDIHDDLVAAKDAIRSGQLLVIGPDSLR